MYQQISAYSQHEVALSLSRWRSLHALSGGHQRPLKVCRGEPPQVTRSGGCQNKVKPRTSVSGTTVLRKYSGVYAAQAHEPVS